MKTKNYSIVVSAVLALSVANAFAQSSFSKQNACDVKYNLHEQLADIVTNDQSARVINLFRQNIQEICQDPYAHNAIVDFVDLVWDASNNENVMKSLELLFAWTRDLIKDPSLQEIYRENLRGLHYLADNEKLIFMITDTVLFHVNLLVHNEHFDTAFEPLMENVAKMMNFGKNMIFNAAAKAFLPKSQSPEPQSPKPKSAKSLSPKLQSLKQQFPTTQSLKPQSPKPQLAKSQSAKQFPYHKPDTSSEMVDDELISEDDISDDVSNPSRNSVH